MAKTSLFDIGYILIDNIINIKNDSNKIKLMAAIKTHNIDIMDKKEKIIEKKNEYSIKYDLKRKNNIDNYEKYLRNKEDLYNKWNKTKAVKDLYDLLSLQRPEYIEIQDIYTIDTIDKINNYVTK